METSALVHAVSGDDYNLKTKPKSDASNEANGCMARTGSLSSKRTFLLTRLNTPSDTKTVQNGKLPSPGTHSGFQHSVDSSMFRSMRDHIPEICECLKTGDISEGNDVTYSTVDELLQRSIAKKAFHSESALCDKRFKINAVESESSRITTGHETNERHTEMACCIKPDDQIHLRSFDVESIGTPGGHVYIDNVVDDDNFSLSTDTSSEYDVIDDTSFVISYLDHLHEYTECEICYQEMSLFRRYCCLKPFCESCISTYCQLLVENGNIKFPCPNPDCDTLIYQNEVFARLDKGSKSKLYRNLINANRDPLKKTCPQCSEVMSLCSDVKLNGVQYKKYGLQVTCSRCHFDWCFHCHAPSHKGVTCKQFRKGDKLLKKWAKERNAGQVNARRCPKCKIYIQRVSGCDHMTCSRCGRNFCYRCGCRFRSLRFLGDHYSKFSIFGCKYLLFPKTPFLRNLVRGSMFGGTIIIASILGALVVAGGIAVFAGAVVASPLLAGLAIRRRNNRRRNLKEIAEMHQHDRQRIKEIRSSGDPYWDKYSYLQQIGVTNMWHMYKTSHNQEGHSGVIASWDNNDYTG